MAKDPTPPHGGHKPADPAPRSLEGTELPDHLRGVQSQAQQSPPKPVKLDPAKDELGTPADAPPVPPRAQAEPVPRVIDQHERSPDPQKWSRFKIRCVAPYGSQPVRYVLAKKGDKQGAIDHYLETCGIRAMMDTFPESQAPKPQFHVKELVD